MFKKKKAKRTEALIPLQDLIFAMRIIRKLHSKYEDRLYELYSMHSDTQFTIRKVETEIEAHGYKKIDGKFYRLSDFELLSPLDI